MRSVRIKVDLRRVPRKIQKIVHDPVVLKHLGETWKPYFDMFTPQHIADTGEVTDNGYITYNSPDAHYYWVGDEYIYNFYEDALGNVHYEYFAPAGETKFKHPEGTSLKYDTKLVNSDYTPKWHETAYLYFHNDVADEMTDFIANM
jgi:hypothetical protein